MAKPQKVIATLEIELHDPDQWSLAFGVEGKAKITKDVREYVENLAGAGVFDNGEVTATITVRELHRRKESE